MGAFVSRRSCPSACACGELSSRSFVCTHTHQHSYLPGLISSIPSGFWDCGCCVCFFLFFTFFLFLLTMFLHRRPSFARTALPVCPCNGSCNTRHGEYTVAIKQNKTNRSFPVFPGTPRGWGWETHSIDVVEFPPYFPAVFGIP